MDFAGHPLPLCSDSKREEHEQRDAQPAGDHKEQRNSKLPGQRDGSEFDGGDDSKDADVALWSALWS